MNTLLIALLIIGVTMSEADAQWVASIKTDETTDEQIAVFRTISLTHADRRIISLS